MPAQTCVLVNCRNRSSRVKLLRFQANKEQTKKWIATVNRKNWSPTEVMSVVIILLLVGKPVVYKIIALVFCQLDSY